MKNSRLKLLASYLAGVVLLQTACAVAQESGAAPAVEAKSGEKATEAAPKDNDKFRERHKTLVALAEKGGIDVCFIGDSITKGWWNAPAWKESYAPLKAANFGVAGDRTGQVLWRLRNGELPEQLKPKVFVLLIGTNNAKRHEPEEVAAGIEEIVKLLRTKRPEAKVLLLGIFPRGEKPNPLRDRIKRVNETIAKLDDGANVRFLDFGDKLLSPDGSISSEIMKDYLHLTPKGYEIWAESMNPLLKELLR